MTRHGGSASDVQALSFDHDSEQRDIYGNVTFDAESGSTIEWNILNLPRKITGSDESVTKYTYLADGTKVQAGDGTLDYVYLGSMVFMKLRNRLTFESMGFAEGRIVANTTGKGVHYHITDHLGSVRTVVDEGGNVVAENDYYPYGKRINRNAAAIPGSKDRYTFSGKEDQSLIGGSPLLDFGARMMSPNTGRWMSVDPMAEKYYGFGRHVYCAGNPVNREDSDGRAYNFVFGVLIGAASSYVGQVAANYLSGQRGRDAWLGNIDIYDVITSSLEGLVTGGKSYAN